jgi:N-acetylglutamate synthase-like GNAT family acetyltransferase
MLQYAISTPQDIFKALQWEDSSVKDEDFVIPKEILITNEGQPIKAISVRNETEIVAYLEINAIVVRNSMYLRSLIINPSWRNKGIGKEIVSTICLNTKIPIELEYTPISEFFWKKMGFTYMGENKMIKNPIRILTEDEKQHNLK